MSADSMSDSNAPDVEHTNNEIMNVTDAQSDGVVLDDVALENEQDMLVTAEHNQADGTALNPADVEPALPERPYAPVSVVTERFLRAIIAKIPIERIAELHLFSPLRQGGVETGIAVIAADVEVAEIEDSLPTGELELALTGEERSGSPENAESDFNTQSSESVESAESHFTSPASELVENVEQHFTTEDSEGSEGSAESDDSARDADVVSFDGGGEDSARNPDESVEFEAESNASDVNGANAIDTDDDSPYADEDVAVIASDAVAHAITSSADATGIPDTQHLPTARVRLVRHTVYTARYRLVLKGPDRGKWESDVKNEADAPLVAVETVVRGVQRRAGEATETVRYDAAQIAQALRMVTPS